MEGDNSAGIGGFERSRDRVRAPLTPQKEKMTHPDNGQDGPGYRFRHLLDCF